MDAKTRREIAVALVNHNLRCNANILSGLLGDYGEDLPEAKRSLLIDAIMAISNAEKGQR